MSFAARVKEEIFRGKPRQRPEYRAFCYGLFLFGRRFDEEMVSLSTENADVSKLYVRAVRDILGIRVGFSEQKTLRGASRFLVDLTEPRSCKDLLKAFGHQPDRFAEGFAQENCFPPFLAGAFLVCGTASEPEKSYRLEFLAPDGDRADFLFETLCLAGYPPKSTQRRGETVLYYKESEQIEELLTLMGAPHCALSLMETKIFKDIRNRANRATNCETANIDKLVRAAGRQLEDIRFLREQDAFSSLPPAAQAVAILREENPDSSLTELSALAGLSRSGVNHRFGQIERAARRMREGETET